MFEDLEKTFSKKVEDRVRDTGDGYMDTVNSLPRGPQLFSDDA